MKPELRMVKERASERFDEILIEEEDLISREGLLKYIRSNSERLSLRNTPKAFFTNT